MMGWMRSFVIAFSLYSKIPMPCFEWKDEDMRYVLVFFPFVGVVVGAAVYGWTYICYRLQVNDITRILFTAALPIIITGGFHIDGYMDTMDALHSYGSRECKQEILKDSHIGAFSVIMLLLYYLIYIAAFAEIRDERIVMQVAFGFVISRCISGISVVAFKPARKEGILKKISDSADEKTVFVLLIIQLILSGVCVFLCSMMTGCIILFLLLCGFLYYRIFSYREFGGVTGDTAGCFLLISELMIVLGGAVGGRF